MATINLLVKDFIEKRVPGEIISVPVEEADSFTRTTDSPSTTDNEWQDNSGSSDAISTAECLASGGEVSVLPPGYCQYLNVFDGGVAFHSVPLTDP